MLQKHRFDYPEFCFINYYSNPIRMTRAIAIASEMRLMRTAFSTGQCPCPCDSSGGISHAGHWLMDPTKESFEDHVFRNIKGKVKLLLSQLDDRERDVLGASALAWDVPEYSLLK